MSSAVSALKQRLRAFSQWFAAAPERPFLVLLCTALTGMLVFAPLEAPVRHYATSGSYQDVADLLGGFGIKGFWQERGALYPLILALSGGLGMAHYAAVGLFNLAGIGVLAWRLAARGMGRLALYTALAGGVMLFSAVNVGFATSLLPEAVALGGAALCVALWLEVWVGGRSFRATCGLMALSMWLAYHLGGALFYAAAVGLPVWLWVLVPRCGVGEPGPRRNVVALVSLMVVGGVVLSNPNLKLIDNVGRSGAVRMDTYAMQAESAARARAVGVTYGSRLPLELAVSRPALFFSYTFGKAVPALWHGFALPLGRYGVCTQERGNPHGLPGVVCGAVAWGVGLGYLLLLGAALGAWALRRSLEAETGALLVLSGVFWGTAGLICLVAWNDAPRFLFLPLAYGVVAMPLAAHFFLPVAARLKATRLPFSGGRGERADGRGNGLAEAGR
ncbi:MAG: hypothetical protein OEW11_09955 [Nitrospirota bacterium]|nr:hypothetical protein [Nitrospirota bacterium]